MLGQEVGRNGNMLGQEVGRNGNMMGQEVGRNGNMWGQEVGRNDNMLGQEVGSNGNMLDPQVGSTATNKPFPKKGILTKSRPEAASRTPEVASSTPATARRFNSEKFGSVLAGQRDEALAYNTYKAVMGGKEFFRVGMMDR
jgi:hypothetical protein